MPAWGWGPIERLAQDARYGARALKGTPLVSLVAILSLALGIGANTAMFSVVDTLILRSLPVSDPEQLALLRSDKESRTHWTNPIWEQIRDRPDLFAGAFATSNTRFNLSPSGETQLVDGLWASGNTFEVLGVRAVIGRMFSEQDDRPGGGVDGPVAVISHVFWHRQFDGSPDVIGRTITIERVPFTIVGVAPPQFFGVEVGRTFDVAVPIGTATLIRSPGALRQRSSWWLRIMTRLKPGQSTEAATAQLRALQPQIREATLPDDWHPWALPQYLADPFRIELASTGDSPLRRTYQRPLTTIMVVVTLVLLIACANLANLLLARAAARRQELAVRIALGASRLRIFRQLLSESLLLAAGGALLGLGLAYWSSRVLVQMLSTPANNIALDLSLNWRVLSFAAAAALVTAVLFGTAPALAGSRRQPNELLKAQARTVAGESPAGAGQLLVVLQVAMSLVLVVTAVLFVRTFASLASVPRGFDDRRILTASVSFPSARIPVDKRPELFRQLLESVRAVPGVANAALSNGIPLTANTWSNVIELPGGPDLPPLERLTHFNMVSPEWFETYGIRLLAGRDFSTTDTADSPPVAIVNQAFARRFTGGRNPIGVRVRQPGNIEREIVGYVEDAVYRSLRDPVLPTLYIAYRQQQQLSTSMTVSARAAGNSPGALARPLVETIRGVNRDLVISVQPLSDNVRGALSQERIVAVLSAFFGALALLLAAIGLYGVTSYSVHRRRSEIGVRIALGSTPRAIIALVLRRAVLLVCFGIVAGTAASLWASRFVAPLLFGLQPHDPATVLCAVAVLAAVAMLAASLPAYRASRTDPARVMTE
jgi:putative ABC transport system permease protein